MCVHVTCTRRKETSLFFFWFIFYFSTNFFFFSTFSRSLGRKVLWCLWEKKQQFREYYLARFINHVKVLVWLACMCICIHTEMKRRLWTRRESLLFFFLFYFIFLSCYNTERNSCYAGVPFFFLANIITILKKKKKKEDRKRFHVVVVPK